MRRFVSKREILRRLEALEALHRKPSPEPLPGQQAIDLTPRYEQPTLDEPDGQQGHS